MTSAYYVIRCRKRLIKVEYPEYITHATLSSDDFDFLDIIMVRNWIRQVRPK